jgi:radical SAM-linked protein
VEQRLWVRYAKRGRMRFASHRDFARGFERALRRSGVPVGYSAGFTPHPKVSYAGAAPTGAASEAEYLELGLAATRPPGEVRERLAAALPRGFDVIDVVPAQAEALSDRLQASRWELVLAGMATADVDQAVAAFLRQEQVEVERLTTKGRRRFDARAAVVDVSVREVAGAPRAEQSGASAMARSESDAAAGAPGTIDAGAPELCCATMTMVVRHVSPVVRPDDVLTGLRLVAGFTPPVPPVATRLAQGPLDAGGRLADPLAQQRGAAGGERA